MGEMIFILRKRKCFLGFFLVIEEFEVKKKNINIVGIGDLILIKNICYFFLINYYDLLF